MTDDDNDRERIIIAGSRRLDGWKAKYAVGRAMDTLMADGFSRQPRGPIMVVSGGADGVDRLGEQWAHRHGEPLRVFDVTDEDWQRHGKQAGPMRNEAMAQYADTLVAIWDGESRGTRNMIDKALAHGLETHVYVVDPDQEGDDQ